MLARLSPLLSQAGRSIPWIGSLAIALGACGSSTLDMNSVQQVVKDGIQEKIGITVDSITCPQEEIPMEAGNTFECQVAQGQNTTNVQVKQEDDEGNITWSLEQGLLSLETIQTAIQDELGEGLTADCGGDKFLIANQGYVFKCEASTENGQTRGVEVKVDDAEGNVSFQTLEGFTLNSKLLEGEIQGSFAEKTGLTVANVACPLGVSLAANATSECVIRAEDGSTVVAQVLQKDDRGSVEWNVTRGLLQLPLLEQDIQTKVKAELGQDITAECGEGDYKIVTQGQVFTCTAQLSGGETRTVEVTVEDDVQGNVRWELQR